MDQEEVRRLEEVSRRCPSYWFAERFLTWQSNPLLAPRTPYIPRYRIPKSFILVTPNRTSSAPPAAPARSAIHNLRLTPTVRDLTRAPLSASAIRAQPHASPDLAA